MNVDHVERDIGIGMKHIIDIAISILLYSIAFNNGARSERNKHKGKDIG